MKQIPIFNKKLKKLAKKVHANYLDYTDFLKDSGGYLKAQYAYLSPMIVASTINAFSQINRATGKNDTADTSCIFKHGTPPG